MVAKDAPQHMGLDSYRTHPVRRVDCPKAAVNPRTQANMNRRPFRRISVGEGDFHVLGWRVCQFPADEYDALDDDEDDDASAVWG